MRRLEVARRVDAPASAAWDVLVDVRTWPHWGPSVRSATLEGDGDRIHAAAAGTVTTVLGVPLAFEITEWIEGERWAWNVARLPATGHVVRSLADDRCEVAFDLPLVAAPYAAVCRIALGRIAALLADPA